MPTRLTLTPGVDVVRPDGLDAAFSRYTGEIQLPAIVAATDGYVTAPELDGAATLVADLRRAALVLDPSELGALTGLTARLAGRVRRFGVLDRPGSDGYVLHALFAVKSRPYFDDHVVFDDPREAEAWGGLPTGCLDAPLPN